MPNLENMPDNPVPQKESRLGSFINSIHSNTVGKIDNATMGPSVPQTETRHPQQSRETFF
jgi:hypothetical protein